MTQYGIWTQSAQILCPECATHVGKGMQLQFMYASAKGYCEHCRKPILLAEEIAQEQRLMYWARQASYYDSWMDQTGGMCHACVINFQDFAGKQWCCSCTFHTNQNDPDENGWYTEIYNDCFDLVSEREASSVDEILGNIYWMQRNNCAIPSTK